MTKTKTTRARWRIERGGTPGGRLPGWFAVLTAHDGCVVRCAHVPTFGAAWAVVDLHSTGEATA
ncbi:hypothetical protein ABIC61_000030 [Curtobacterium sp. 1544]